MHKYFLSSAVIGSLLLSLVGVATVGAQKTGSILGTSVNRYLTSTGVYAAAKIDPILGSGTLTVDRTDAKRNTTISTDFAVTPQTVFLRKYGGPTTLSDFRINEELSVYSLRNADGSLTAVTVTNHNLWLVDPVIAKGEVIDVNPSKNTVTVKDAVSEKSYAVTYADDTQIQKPKSVTGTEADLVVGKNVSVRGVVRKIGTTLNIEHASVIWILPEHGE